VEDLENDNIPHCIRNDIFPRVSISLSPRDRKYFTEGKITLGGQYLAEGCHNRAASNAARQDTGPKVKMSIIPMQTTHIDDIVIEMHKVAHVVNQLPPRRIILQTRRKIFHLE
jgi:hypothetical protein